MAKTATNKNLNPERRVQLSNDRTWKKRVMRNNAETNIYQLQTNMQKRLQGIITTYQYYNTYLTTNHAINTLQISILVATIVLEVFIWYFIDQNLTLLTFPIDNQMFRDVHNQILAIFLYSILQPRVLTLKQVTYLDL